MDMTRKAFLKCACASAMSAAMGGASSAAAAKPAPTADGPKSKVWFSPVIDAEHLLRLYDHIKGGISGKVAIKLHTGERHGPNILPRDMVQAFQKTIPNSTIVETNTLYAGDRYTTEQHRETLKVNGWTFCPVDIMDAEGTVNLRANADFCELRLT